MPLSFFINNTDPVPDSGLGIAAAIVICSRVSNWARGVAVNVTSVHREVVGEKVFYKKSVEKIANNYAH
jgi:hypothetical protein